MKSFYFYFSMCIIVALTACGHKQKEVVTSEADRIVKIKAETIQITKKTTELHYSGTIEAYQTIPLSFQSSGIVENVSVQEGDKVKKGQILATVNKSDNENLNNVSVAKYNQAKDAYARLKSVHDSGSLTEIKWVEMETNLKQAESQMLMVQSNLDKCNLRAPADGIIGQRNIEPGQSSISMNTPLELVKIEKVFVKVSVSENEISKIKTGQKATFSISALDGKTFEGTVSNVGVVADRLSRTYEVKIIVINTDLEIKPGMICDVNLQTAIEKKIMLVSKNAINKDSEGKTYVFIVSDDKKSVKKQNITLADYNENGVEVTAGLNPDQMVVVEGKEKLSDNSLISL
jgi:membrane fusion protein, multidrug efflux system